jgi:N-acetylglutamate synthase-like GNAT family acetyltransferase
MIMGTINYTPFERAHLQSVKEFTDRWIGLNYYQPADLEEVLKKSQCHGLNASWLAWDGEILVGVRLTLAPGQWLALGQRVRLELWKVPPERVGYFKSLFIHEDYRAYGIGRELSRRSLEVLANQGAMAVVAHSWLESPNNSSQIYLQKMGFTEVARHPLFWEPIDYQCTRCAPNRCQCTAVEMIKYLN